MSVEASKLNYGVVYGPLPNAIAASKLNYGVVYGPINAVVASKLNYGVVYSLGTPPPVGPRKAGLQIRTPANVVTVDTSTYILKAISTVVAPANTTAVQELSVAAGGPTNIIAGAASFENGGDPQDAVAVNYDVGTGKVQYQFKQTGSYAARINALAF